MPPPPSQRRDGKLQAGAHAALCLQRNCAVERFQTQKRLRHIPVANHFFAQIRNLHFNVQGAVQNSSAKGHTAQQERGGARS